MLAALEVSTRISSVALLDMLGDGETTEVKLPGDVESSSTLLPALEQLLAQKGLTAQDLAAVAVAVGPGSFTGIRVGLATAQGLCLPGGLPAFGIPTLDGLAESMRAEGWSGETYALIDAQRGECFVGHYQIDKDFFRPLSAPFIATPAQLAEKSPERIWLVGPGALKYEKEIRESFGAKAMFAFTQLHQPRASSIARLAFQRWQSGERSKADDLQPLYLRPPAVDEKP